MARYERCRRRTGECVATATRGAGRLLAVALVTTILICSPHPTLGSAQDAGDPVAAATAAALSQFNGVLQSDCLAGNNPNNLSCVALESTATDIARGIAVFGVGDQGGNGGFTAAMGTLLDGSWKIWFTSQNPYQPTRLPGDITVCAAGGGVNLRSGPSTDADVVDTLANGTTVTGEQFVLTEPVDSGHAGYGWFKISSPESGWLYSKYLENAALDDDCALRNAQVDGS